MVRLALVVLVLALPATAVGKGQFLKMDPMDRYINGGSSENEDAAFPAPAQESEKASEPEPSAANKIEDAFKAMDDSVQSKPSEVATNFDAMDAVAKDAGKTSTWSSSFYHFGEHADAGASGMPSNPFSDSPAPSTQDKDTATTPAQQQQDDEPSAFSEQQHQEMKTADVDAAPTPVTAESMEAAPSAQNQVVDIRLDSELQESLLQKKKGVRGRASMIQKKRTSPNVEDAVAKEKMFDVYIHDGFGEQEKKDIKEVKAVNANKDLKA